MAVSPEKAAALAKLAQLEQELKAALENLAFWQERDLRYMGGSPRQETAHEKSLHEARNRASAAQNAVDAQKRLIALLP
ncbi:hypothetical protein [Pseudomonas mosselii]|uniref:hypothetical protein n=1 Tax=Pseudomonas mosselii TaxID=78327 RepID=UPI001E3E11EC|nr:hypothetical protein [Pseudomonas mosselii]MCL8300877.1 hypothetical protein [Pseudomonas mosselii]MCL8341227.1 hypothetical protein [Pseudomonas mosselii]WJR28452.1 hypothetical protein LU678_029685 [Pseudomonas mosselii]